MLAGAVMADRIRGEAGNQKAEIRRSAVTAQGLTPFGPWMRQGAVGTPRRGVRFCANPDVSAKRPHHQRRSVASGVTELPRDGLLIEAAAGRLCTIGLVK